jgi:GPI mannosyltransferase 4
VKIPVRFRNTWLTLWIVSNALLGVLFGIYHQAGIIPAQRFLESQPAGSVDKITWWHTYTPPVWLDGKLDRKIEVKDLMGLDEDTLLGELYNKGECEVDNKPRSLFVAPASAEFLDEYIDTHESPYGITIGLDELWRTERHTGLDDLDFANDGVWKTLRRVIGRRGLVVWQVNKKC